MGLFRPMETNDETINANKQNTVKYPNLQEADKLAICKLFNLVVKYNALSKREMFGDQTLSNIVWWPYMFPFGNLARSHLTVLDKIFEQRQTLDL